MAKQLNFSQPVVLRHASWLVVNNVQGCPKQCKYCFLKPLGQTGVAPQLICSAKSAISALKRSPHYLPHIPVCFYTSTDPFATPMVEKHLKDVLEEYMKEGFKNPVCLVTKCKPSKGLADTFKKLQAHNIPIIAYISYSGLSKDIEVGVNHNKLKEAFIYFKELGIPIIHYWRPLLPQNSSTEKLEEVLSYAQRYSVASVITGLKTYDSMAEQVSFWSTVSKNIKESSQAECAWPIGALSKVKSIAAKYNHPVFQTNSCAISYALNKPDTEGFYSTPSCTHKNICPSQQREQCSEASAPINTENVRRSFKKYGIQDVRFKVQNTPRRIIIEEEIDMPTAASLTSSLNAQIDCKINNSYYWGNSVSGNQGVEYGDT